MPKNITRSRIQIPGSAVEIAIQDYGGDGPLALFHHANGFCSALWSSVAEKLRSRFRVIAMDARGHGDSSNPIGESPCTWERLCEDLEGVAGHWFEESGQQPIALGLGHSFGGTLMMCVAARRPELFEKLILVDPVIFPPDVDRSQTRGNELVARTLKRTRQWDSRAEARAFFGEKELFENWEPGTIDLYVEEGLRDCETGGVELKCAPEVEASIFGGPSTLDIHGSADRLEVPTLMLWARHGNFPRLVFDDVAARMRDGAVEAVDAGHLIPMEDPGRVAEAVLRFCAPGTKGES